MAQRGSTQTALLRALRENEGKSFSGQQLADILGISRAAVNKAAKALQAQGYTISAASGRGYSLQNEGDVLNAQAVEAALSSDSPIKAIHVFKELDSTNKTAKQLAQEGAPHGTLIVAERQLQGRGRLGRQFVSPEGGIYLSLILRPQVDMSDALSVTGCAAVAVSRACRKLYGSELLIKWVNDLYYNGRKVAGILTEGATNFETGQVEYLIVGIGLNLTTPEEAFPPEIRATAGALYSGGVAPYGRAKLATAIAEELLNPNLRSEYLAEYRQRSMVTGHYITVTGDGDPYSAFAERIDDHGQLEILLASGGRKTLRFGEVSIRPVPGSY